MKHLKIFDLLSGYTDYSNSSDFILPNVSYVKEDKKVRYNPFKKKKDIVIKATYNAVSDGDYGMLCYDHNYGNIKSIKIDGNTVQFDPLVNHNSNFEINTVNTVIDWDEWTATCPDEYLINGKIKSWTIKPKDSSIVLTQESFDNEDIVYGYVYKENDTKYFSYYNIYTEDIFNEDGSQDHWKEWDFNIASNSLSLSETPINEDWWSHYNCNFVLLKYNYDTEYYEIIDTVNEVEYTTGGVSLNYIFETEGYHEVEIALKENYTIDNIFENCTSLTSVHIGSGVTSIGYSAFWCCTSLTDVSIPDSVTSIGDYAFYDCGLTSITIPDSVTSIGDYAFLGCISLTSVIIGNSVNSISNSAFHNCTGLTSVHIGSGVTSIGKLAFANCYRLTSIVIPDSVTSIGESAFSGCSGLTEITCNAMTAPTISTDTYENVKENGTLYVPAGSDYSSWMSTDDYYLGKYNWTVEYFIPENAKILEISNYNLEEGEQSDNFKKTQLLFDVIIETLGQENIENNLYSNYYEEDYKPMSIYDATGGKYHLIKLWDDENITYFSKIRFIEYHKYSEGNEYYNIRYYDINGNHSSVGSTKRIYEGEIKYYTESVPI